MKKSTFILSSIIIVALSRLLPHPPNFAPMGAIALFTAYALNQKWMRFVWPLILAVGTDILLVSTINSAYSSIQSHFTSFGTYILYATYLLIGIAGHSFSKQLSSSKVTTVLGLSIGSGILFFITSNFAVWLGGSYGYTIQGFISCYVAAIPFFGNTLGGELFYNTLLFGSFFYLYERKFATASA